MRFITTLLLLYVCSILWAEKPNILLIVVDDLRPELGCYGSEVVKSPNIDQLASQSIQFQHAYCQQAVCLPSRISLFTGMGPDSTGVKDLHTKFRKTIPNAVTIPQHLGANGYHTIAMGKVYHDEQVNEWNEWIDVKEATNVKEYHDPQNVAEIEKLERIAAEKGLKGKKLRAFVKGPAYESADRPDNEYFDGVMTDIAIKKLQEPRDKPLFMTVGYKKPHLPLIAPKKYWDLYPEGSVKMPTNYYTPKNAPQIALMTWGELRAYKDIPAEGQVSDEIALNLRRAYYACVSFVDTQIGRLINALKENGMDKNTIVILTSDHGWKIGEHAMWCKHTNYEIDARVPLIIKTPENQTGRIEQSFTELIDVYPTICNLAGIPTPDDCEGKDLSAWLKNANTAPHPYAISQYKRSRKTGGDVIGYSVKNTGFRYTEWINSETKKVVASELYNHNLDPDENTNVVENPEYKSNIEELSKIIHASLK